MTDFEEKTIEYYNTHAEEFISDTLEADMSELCGLFMNYLPERPRILDLGCGSGRDSRFFLSRGCTVVPVDASEEMCRLAGVLTGLEVRKLRFDELDYESEFDGVWACASLLHAEKDRLPGIFSKIRRALKPHGLLFMSFKCGSGERERNGRYYTDLTQADVYSLCSTESGLSPLVVTVSGDVRKDRSEEKWLNVIAEKI